MGCFWGTYLSLVEAMGGIHRHLGGYHALIKIIIVLADLNTSLLKKF